MTAFILAPELRAELSSIVAAGRRLAPLLESWTTPEACRKARADLDQIINDAKAAKRGIPK